MADGAVDGPPDDIIDDGEGDSQPLRDDRGDLRRE